MPESIKKQAGGDGDHQLQVARRSLQNINWQNKKILDIGSSNGFVTSEILKFTQAKEIIGVEFAPERVAAANLLKRNFPAGKLDFIQADATDLSRFKDNSFDGIFSNMVFQQIPREKLLLALKEVQRLLRPQAMAIINFNQEKSAVTIELQKIILKKNNIAKTKNINLEVFKEQALNVGFSQIECTVNDDVYYHQTLDDLLGAPAQSAWIFRDAKLDEQQIQEIWQKVRKIFKSQETDLGFKEIWNIVFARLIK